MSLARRLAKNAFAGLGVGLLAVAWAYAQSGSVRFHGPLSRVVTPNGDGINDAVFFCFENPQDAEISGKIYTLLGGEVASIGPRRDRTGTAGSACPAAVVRAQYTTWDSAANVRSGIYVYRITTAEQLFTGTVLVVR